MSKKGEILLEHARMSISKIEETLNKLDIKLIPRVLITSEIEVDGKIEVKYKCPFCGETHKAILTSGRSIGFCPGCFKSINISNYPEDLLGYEGKFFDDYSSLIFSIRYTEIIDDKETDSTYGIILTPDFEYDEGNMVKKAGYKISLKWAMYCQKDSIFFFDNPMGESSEKRKSSSISSAIRKSRWSYGGGYRCPIYTEDEGSYFGLPIQTQRYNLESGIKEYYRKLEESALMKKSKEIEVILPDEEMLRFSKFFEIKEQLRDRRSGIGTYNVTCNKCHHSFSCNDTGRYHSFLIECPECGQAVNSVGNKYNTYLYVKDKKLYLFNQEWDDTLKQFVNRYYAETELGKRTASCLIYNDRSYSWTKTTRNSRDWAHLVVGNLIIDNSDFLRYSGIKEYYHSLQESDYYHADEMVLNYLLALSSYPVVEKIYKAGYIRAFEDEKPNIVLTADNLNEAFKLNKTGLKALKEIYTKNLTHYYFQPLAYLQNIYAIDKEVSFDNLIWLYKHKVNMSCIIEIAEVYKLSVNDIVQYLIRVYENQCFEASGALVEWRDYLHTAKLLGMDLSDNHVKYPRSLKLEHDRVTMRFKIISDEEKEKAFKLRTEAYSKRLSYKNDKFFIKVPESTTELFNEGKKLCHCVGTYADRIISGTSCILFIRKQDEPDVPYYTCEVSDNSIVQIRGLHNTTFKSSDLSKFIDEWKKNKAIA